MDRPVEQRSGAGPENAALRAFLLGRERLLDSIPRIPAVVQSILKELDLPPEKVDLRRVADLVSRDESLTAQTLRVANSPLFGLARNTNSIVGAVRTLGFSRIRDIATSRTIMRLGSAQKVMDPRVFWEHSLGCAILSRKLARSVLFEDPDKAYLAGLLHDIGFIVNLMLAPQKMQQVIEIAQREKVFMGDVEGAILGFTHCESGEVLALRWKFSSDNVEAIRHHHSIDQATVAPALVAIVSLGDRACRTADLGVGYPEPSPSDEVWQHDWDILKKYCPTAHSMTWQDFDRDSQRYLPEIQALVKTIFAGAS